MPRGHLAPFLDTRSRKRARSVARASGDLRMRRAAAAPTTATMQITSMTSIHADHASVPVPKLCTTAMGHEPYESQWIARHAEWPIMARTRPVTVMAMSSSIAITPMPSQNVRW